MAFASSHIILSAKIRVRSRRTCCQHATGAVSRWIVSFGELYRLITFVAFTIDALPPGYMYYGPNGADDSNLCKCNTVAYSLMSACGGCQGAEWVTYDIRLCYSLLLPGAYVSAISWSEHSLHCTETLFPSS
jgi:hypothetical protein